jgi:hypothetical protein
VNTVGNKCPSQAWALLTFTLEPIMATKPANHGKTWTSADNRNLKQLAQGNTPTRVMGLKLGRTPDSVQSHASELGVSLKPVNQSPYGTQKK